ncbi:MAG TPA: acetate kinase, partial [bacterium]|nr:acetate kinase [bacterium]
GKKRWDFKIITCHLGNGCSMAAISNGKSVDTSMGLTPLEGLVMGTRCGDIDPAVVLYMIDLEGYNPEKVGGLMNKKSGLLGVSGVSNDMRELLQACEQGNERAQTAVDIFCYRIKKYIGAYAAAMGGVDLVIFTGGIGENAPIVRKKCCEDLAFMNIEIDDQANNNVKGRDAIISNADRHVKVFVVHTNEEVVIARDSVQCVLQGAPE